jgi:hypothetical protein
MRTGRYVKGAESRDQTVDKSDVPRFLPSHIENLGRSGTVNTSSEPFQELGMDYLIDSKLTKNGKLCLNIGQTAHTGFFPISLGPVRRFIHRLFTECQAVDLELTICQLRPLKYLVNFSKTAEFRNHQLWELLRLCEFITAL